jgi:hypothetical protein
MTDDTPPSSSTLSSSSDKRKPAASEKDPKPKRQKLDDEPKHATLWYSTDFTTHGLLPPAAVIVAATEEDAKKALDAKLVAANLFTFREKGYTLVNIILDVPRVIDLSPVDRNKIDLKENVIKDYKKQLHAYYSIDFKRPPPLYAAAIVIAESIDHAESLLSSALRKAAIEDDEHFSLNPLSLKEPAIVLSLGETSARFVPDSK